MQSGKESGFNLIEVMITSLILAIGLLGIVALQGIAKKSLGTSDKQIEAAFHARTALAELRADTSWVNATSSSNPTQEKLLNGILQLTVSSALTTNLDLCYQLAANNNISIVVSWQIQDEAIATGQENDGDCGKPVSHRRQTSLSARITGDL